MQFRTFALLSAGLTVAACGGGDKKAAAPPASTTPAAAAPAGNPAPITGGIKVVQMIGDATGMSKFEPATITIKEGDGIRFDAISGGPHNIAFDPATLSPEAKAALAANMPSQDLGELSGKLVNNGENYTISFANVPPGTYVASCTPHAANNMKMTITVTK
jgi:plastocyanin